MDLQRIIDNTIVDDKGCWIWTRSFTTAGYGQLWEDGTRWDAHRYSYSCVNGYVDDGVMLRHKCHNRKCCHPDHIQQGTGRDNYYDSADVHRRASEARRFKWLIAGREFSTFRAALAGTGLTANSLNKYSANGKFDLEAYREGCKKGNVVPKI